MLFSPFQSTKSDIFVCCRAMSTHDHAEDEQHDLEVATVLATGLYSHI